MKERKWPRYENKVRGDKASEKRGERKCEGNM